MREYVMKKWEDMLVTSVKDKIIDLLLSVKMLEIEMQKLSPNRNRTLDLLSDINATSRVLMHDIKEVEVNRLIGRSGE